MVICSKDIHQRMRALRLKKALTLTDLARLVDTNAGTITAWETGSSTPTYKFLIRLAQAFDVSLDFLMCVSNIRREFPRE